MTHQLDHERQELHFLAATQAPRLATCGAALAALQEGELSDAKRDAWRERRDAAFFTTPFDSGRNTVAGMAIRRTSYSSVRDRGMNCCGASSQWPT